MATPQLLIGIDAGGTSTKCMAVIEKTTATIVGGPGNFVSIGQNGFALLLRALQKDLKKATGLDPKEAAGVCIGGAGLGRQHERFAAEAIAKKLFPHAAIVVTDDATLFLWAAFGAKPGIAVMAGTGSICMGRGEDARTVRAGGWGPYLGDPGSAFAIGRRAIVHALAVRDGVEKPSPLVDAVAQHFAVTDALSVLTHIGTGGPGVIASLAPCVLQAAALGEKVAARIVADEAAALATFVKGVYLHLDSRVAAVACGGGLFENTYFADAGTRAIRNVVGAVRVSVPHTLPVEGAILLARAKVENATH
jgi:N-acetylglucosamine kinase-like BadF-type ATPase